MSKYVSHQIAPHPISCTSKVRALSLNYLKEKMSDPLWWGCVSNFFSTFNNDNPFSLFGVLIIAIHCLRRISKVSSLRRIHSCLSCFLFSFVPLAFPFSAFISFLPNASLQTSSKMFCMLESMETLTNILCKTASSWSLKSEGTDTDGLDNAAKVQMNWSLGQKDRGKNLCSSRVFQKGLVDIRYISPWSHILTQHLPVGPWWIT